MRIDASHVDASLRHVVALGSVVRPHEDHAGRDRSDLALVDVPHDMAEVDRGSALFEGTDPRPALRRSTPHEAGIDLLVERDWSPEHGYQSSPLGW